MEGANIYSILDKMQKIYLSLILLHNLTDIKINIVINIL